METSRTPGARIRVAVSLVLRLLFISRPPGQRIRLSHNRCRTARVAIRRPTRTSTAYAELARGCISNRRNYLNGHAFAAFPTLHGGDVALQIDRNLPPGIQSVLLRTRRARCWAAEGRAAGIVAPARCGGNARYCTASDPMTHACSALPLADTAVAADGACVGTFTTSQPCLEES